MFEKTTPTMVEEKGAIWAIPRTPHQIKASEDGCPFYYELKAGHHSPWQDGAIKLHELTLAVALPGGIPLLEKAIETYKEKIDEERITSAKKVADLQARIDTLALIEYIPSQPEPTEDDLEEEDCDPGNMDGDHDSAMASAGFGTDEDYGGGTERL